MDKELSVIDRKIHRSQGKDSLDEVKVGDWFWVKHKDWSDEEKRELFCVKHIGSNYLEFTHHYKDRGTTGFRLHFDDFEESCKKENNWKEYINNRIAIVQKQIREKTNKMIEEGGRLYLIKIGTSEEYTGTLLPSTVSADPDKYKSELVKFQTETMPKIQEDIKNLSIEYGGLTKDLSMSDLVRFELVKKAFEKVQDRIFNIEIYTGIKESIKQIAEGEPALLNEPISIRQQLLYMDEECLIDFDKGGMDFESLNDFDKWVAKPENLSRILPEQKAIVGFRVRRNSKEYSIPRSLFDIFINIQKDLANLQTYLLIRNGKNIYRIASQVDFSPRLIPRKDEIGEKQFLEYDHWDRKKEPKLITPDNVKYDDHVEKMDEIIRQYNCIFILIQGLLDRAFVFHPHPGIKLNRSEDIGKWIKCIRDEETGLPNATITFEEYRNQLNKTLRKGKWVWSNWVPSDLGTYSWNSNLSRYTAREYQIVHRPEVCKVVRISRDKSHVEITWETNVLSWERVNDTINRHLNVPIDQIFNLSDYTKGDYKMFLCDRALQGKYLEWAPPLLTAEKMKLEKKRRRIEVKEEKQPGFTDPIGPNGPPFPED